MLWKFCVKFCCENYEETVPFHKISTPGYYGIFCSELIGSWFDANVKFISKFWQPLRKKCPHSELLWSVFSRIRTEYGEIICIYPYSVRMRENKDRNNYEYGHFSRSVYLSDATFTWTAWRLLRCPTVFVIISFKPLQI